MMPKPLIELDRILDFIEKYVVGYSTIIFAVLLFVNVVARRFGAAMAWVGELVIYLNMLGVFIIIASGFKFGSHVGVSAFIEFIVPKKLQKYFDEISYAFVGVFCIIFGYESIRMSVAQVETGQLSSLLHIPLALIYGLCAVGMLFALMRTVMNMAKKVNEIREAKANDMLTREGGKEK